MYTCETLAEGARVSRQRTQAFNICNMMRDVQDELFTICRVEKKYIYVS